MSFGTFFLPGPTEVRTEVLEAMLRPMIPHKSAAFEALFAAIQERLKLVFRTERPVFISTSSATGLMEAGIRCASPGAILALTNGAFSERFAKISNGCGRETDLYEVPWGSVHDPDVLDAKLAAKRYAAIAVVHSETSTGALNDVRALSDVAHRHGVTCLVDSVSGIGGAELHFDEWQLDYALTGAQKALALPPGLAFAAASESFIAKARTSAGRGVYFDLVELAQVITNNQTTSTPAISLYYALDKQLEWIAREGMPSRWARHMAMAQKTWAWVGQMRQELDMDIRVLAPTGYRSPTVTVVVVPTGLTGDQIVEEAGRHGFTLGPGFAKLRETTFRIGHMGDHTEETVQRCLDATEQALSGTKMGLMAIQK